MGPERGSEILCVLTHGMGSTPPPPEDVMGDRLGILKLGSFKLLVVGGREPGVSVPRMHTQRRCVV